MLVCPDISYAALQEVMYPGTQGQWRDLKERYSLRGSLNLRKSVERWSLALNIRDLITDGMRDTGRRKGYRWSLWIGGGGRHAYGLSTKRSQHQPAA